MEEWIERKTALLRLRDGARTALWIALAFAGAIVLVHDWVAKAKPDQHPEMVWGMLVVPALLLLLAIWNYRAYLRAKNDPSVDLHRMYSTYDPLGIRAATEKAEQEANRKPRS